MKYILSVLLSALSIKAISQKHSLEKIWETQSIIAVPESVLPVNNILYITLIDGAPWGADGKGGVGKLTLAGKVIDTSWITGLHAPKGMGKVGNRLYVADITEVIVIDIAKGKIETRIKVDSAVALNDITVTDKGVVYVSDSRTGKIWRVENNIPHLFLDNMTNVNGLKAINDDLFIASGTSFVKAGKDKKVTLIAELPQGGDGVEPVGNGDFIVTSWMGYVYYVTASGIVDTLLDLTKEKKNTADIGYDAAKRIVYLPTFNGKTVAAYRLK